LAFAPRIVINALGEKWRDCLGENGSHQCRCRRDAKRKFSRKFSLRQQTVAKVSGAMRIRNIGMLLNPSPCQIVDAAQHHGVIRERTHHSLRWRAFREEAN
jgi:hypothetical protein